MIGENAKKAFICSHLMTPAVVVLIDQYPAIEVEKTAATGMIAEKSLFHRGPEAVRFLCRF